LESSPESDEGCSEKIVSKITKLLLESNDDKYRTGKKLTVKYGSSGESDCQYTSAIIISSPDSSCRSVKKIKIVTSNEGLRSKRKNIVPDEMIIKKLQKVKPKESKNLF